MSHFLRLKYLLYWILYLSIFVDYKSFFFRCWCCNDQSTCSLCCDWTWNCLFVWKNFKTTSACFDQYCSSGSSWNFGKSCIWTSQNDAVHVNSSVHNVAKLSKQIFILIHFFYITILFHPKLIFLIFIFTCLPNIFLWVYLLFFFSYITQLILYNNFSYLLFAIIFLKSIVLLNRKIVIVFLTTLISLGTQLSINFV